MISTTFISTAVFRQRVYHLSMARQLWWIFYYGDHSWCFQISGILSLISGLGCAGYQPISEKWAVHIAVNTYEVLQKSAEIQSKTFEEIIEETVSNLEKEGRWD